MLDRDVCFPACHVAKQLLRLEAQNSLLHEGILKQLRKMGNNGLLLLWLQTILLHAFLSITSHGSLGDRFLQVNREGEPHGPLSYHNV